MRGANKVLKPKPKPKKKSAKASSQVHGVAVTSDDDTECIFCAELYLVSGGQRIQCTECRRWAHTECAGVSDNDDTSFARSAKTREKANGEQVLSGAGYG